VNIGFSRFRAVGEARVETLDAARPHDRPAGPAVNFSLRDQAKYPHPRPRLARNRGNWAVWMDGEGVVEGEGTEWRLAG